jgi:hypothetical protein
VKPTAIVEIKSDKGVIHGWRAEHAAQASTLPENEYSKERIHLFLRANDFRNENLLGWDDTRWSGYVLGTI